MATQSKLSSAEVGFARRALLGLAALLILCALGAAGRMAAQESAMHDRIYVVAHVDLIPPHKLDGTKLVQQYVVDTRKDPGLVRIEAGSEISRDNHITVVEVWQNRKAYDEHIANAHARDFRQHVDPMLGDPYDERLHQSLE